MTECDAPRRAPKRGRLIAFEGPNNVGKTTVSRELSKKLGASGRWCEWHAFPGRSSGTLGQHVYDLHHKSASFGVGEIAPSAIQALHIAAHLDAIERTILPKLATGADIVLDRYWWSTIAYGVATGVQQRLLESLVASELIAWNGLQPTLVVVLDRSIAKPQSHQLICPDVLRREYRRLLGAADDRHPACFIDNNGTVEQTVAGIVDLLARLDARGEDVE